MSANRLRVPALTLHKTTGRARERLDGRDVYLGSFGSAEANERYRRLVAEWLAHRSLPPANGRPRQAELPLSVSGLILQYLQFTDGYYRKGGRPTSEAGAVRDAMRALREHYGRTPAAEFGPLKLKAVREALVAQGLARSTINGRVLRIRRLFKWATENELVSSSVHHALQAVAGLRKGRTDAREPPPVLPVDPAAINAVLPEVAVVPWTGRRCRLAGFMPDGRLSVPRRPFAR